MLRETLRKILPKTLKINVQLLKGEINNLRNGYSFNFVKSNNSSITYPVVLTLKQEIKTTTARETKAKIANLNRAVDKVGNIEINPNEIFSFWKIIGNPSKKNGYSKSISILNGKKIDSYGGGLCQISGLIYYMCLHSGIAVLERHNHSLDLYTDDTRYTPLGSDATVVYGYKDLKIKNNYDTPIKFNLDIVDNELIIKLSTESIIKKAKIEFLKNTINNSTVEVITKLSGKTAFRSIYKKPPIAIMA